MKRSDPKVLASERIQQIFSGLNSESDGAILNSIAADRQLGAEYVTVDVSNVRRARRHNSAPNGSETRAEPIFEVSAPSKKSVTKTRFVSKSGKPTESSYRTAPGKPVVKSSSYTTTNQAEEARRKKKIEQRLVEMSKQ